MDDCSPERCRPGEVSLEAQDDGRTPCQAGFATTSRPGMRATMVITAPMIPQKAVSQVRLGQAIELSLDAYPGERFRGEIIALNPRHERFYKPGSDIESNNNPQVWF